VREDIYKPREDNGARNYGGETEGKAHLGNLDIDRTKEMILNLISNNLQRQGLGFS
jgi:hypothetical protein